MNRAWKQCVLNVAVLAAVALIAGAIATLFTGCVSLREARRYGEGQHSFGVIEGIVKGAEPWKSAYLECDRTLALERARSDDGTTMDERAEKTAQQLRESQKHGHVEP